MKFSMNGYRRQLSEDISNLKRIVEDIKTGNQYAEDELIEITNDLICKSNGLNCVSIKDDESFSDMSDLEIELIEDEAPCNEAAN